MFRAFCLPFFLILCLVGSASADAPRRTVNLSEPGKLEELQRDNPAHYQKVRKILDSVLIQPESKVRSWMQTTFDARDVRYAPIILTTYPPRRDLSFTLDDTQYLVRLTLTHVQPRMRPAK